ncbi:MAG: mannitol dehydrogenase family protein [Paracoccaceae bacterium]
MKLNTQTLPQIAAQTPGYDRAQITTGIVHLGVGAFQRAHQAVYVDDLLTNDPRWGIVGASLRSAATAQALNPQDGLYSVTTKSGDGESCRVVGSLQKVITAPDDPEALIVQMAEPNVRIVTMTVTEKGYCFDPSRDELDDTNPDIQHDLNHPNTPRSAPGFLVAALRRRMETKAGPFTVLSCDNLPQNGDVTRKVVTGLAQQIDPVLAKWIKDNVTFPATMVDRIVPATTPDDKIQVANALGVTDEWPIVTEPFGQWVIEDNFCAGRPDFESVGAILTDDVHPFETMKLRMLNGSHSALAYRGALAGHTTVAQAIADPEIHAFISDMMQHEVAPNLNVPSGIDLAVYQSDLLARFSNPSLNHSLLQIATDGSQKLPQRILDPIRDRIAQGQSFDGLAQGVAYWIRFVTARQGNEYLFSLNDPLAEDLRPNDIKLGEHSESLLKNTRIFGHDLPKSEPFMTAVLGALSKLPQ